MFNLSDSDFSAWIVSTGMQGVQIAIEILLALVAGYIGAKLIRKGLRYAESLLINRLAEPEGPSRETQQRVNTLMDLLRKIALALLWAIVALVVLAQLGLNITPILAGAGILGLAVGFGAQNLVRDVITGFFLILENQIRVGDVAIINGTSGVVERINFRIIRLRDLAGTVHVFPNGAITSLSNMTQDWSAYVFDIGVAYKEDTDRVVEVLHRVGAELREDEYFGPLIIDEMEIFGVQQFADSAVMIRGRLKTLPIRQWETGRQFLRRVKKAFDAEGIEIPFPHRSIYFGAASQPIDVLLSRQGTDGASAAGAPAAAPGGGD